MSVEDTMKDAAASAVEESSSPKEKLRNHCMSLGYVGILKLGKLFRMQDDDRSGTLSLEEMAQGISQIGLELSDDEVAELFQEFDADGTGSVNYEEFLAAIRPEMSEDRMAVVEEAYATLDEAGDGKVTLDDLKEKFSASNHPSVQDGSESEDEVLGRFISRLEEGASEDGAITKNEFIDYYSGISNSMDNDELFIEIIKNTYGL